MNTVKTKIRTFTLTELGESINSVIEGAYKRTYWVKAEIVKLNYYPKSGHCYPDLVDKVNNKIKSQFRGILWGKDYQRIQKEFLTNCQSSIKSGMKVLMEVKVQYHPVYGLSLHILDIDVNFTIGEMALNRAATLSKLKKENVFNLNKILEFPILPKRLAVISVETSKGYQDFINIIQKSNYGIQITLFPALLQGDAAVASIKKQLKNIQDNLEEFDAVAIIRGGGGEIGLDCYDAYALAKQITLMHIPVLAGIGHAANTTVVELVSYKHFITPTELAYFIVSKFEKQFTILTELTQQLDGAVTTLFLENNEQISRLSKTISTSVNYSISTHRSLLNNLVFTFNKQSSMRLWTETNNINSLEKTLFRNVKTLMSKTKEQLSVEEGKLVESNKKLILNNTQQLSELELKIEFLNPKNILKRGYSLQHNKDGDIIVSADGLNKGDLLITQFKDGVIESVISKTKK